MTSLYFRLQESYNKKLISDRACLAATFFLEPYVFHRKEIPKQDLLNFVLNIRVNQELIPAYATQTFTPLGRLGNFYWKLFPPCQEIIDKEPIKKKSLFSRIFSRS